MAVFRFLFCFAALSCCLAGVPAAAQPFENDKYGQPDKFRQLDEILPAPSSQRTASGAPGPGYWQQRADYVIDVQLIEETREIRGSETITYTNHSPHALTYLWLQLDPNYFAPNSRAALTATAPDLDPQTTFESFEGLLQRESFDGGVKITAVLDAQHKPLPHTIVETMMRIDLPEPLDTGQTIRFSVDWHYTINDAGVLRGRTGYEHFPEDGNAIFEIAQWYPRMAAYTDYEGWQHKQYLGRGEFTLEFGDYLVRITVPDDHQVAATGVLINAGDVLSDEQRRRLDEARTAKTPVFIVTPDEAKANEQKKPAGEKTWIFQAENVRDFAFASSRKFIWDAMGHTVEGNRVMAMSFYPKEGEPLWSKYSTHAVVHTLDVYSRFTFPYPYPVAISVNGPVGGMEYPMICFNGPRPEKDGTYSKRTKYGLISVIIHEVGHNYFPMIVNSDERQWTWLDEGLNTFLQYLSEQEWEQKYPSNSGEPQRVVSFMQSHQQMPVMTQSDSILQFYDNAYKKPATALNVLRETVLGRELFDYAFQQYARRWMFKRPTPADFFRTMEDASGTDLDWFWRGWFYSTDHCDLAITDLRRYELDSGNPEIDKARSKAQRDAQPQTLPQQRNRDLPKRVDAFPELKDFYNTYDELDVTEKDRQDFERWQKRLTEEEKQLLQTKKFFYVVDLKNVGGLIMPVILEIQFADGKQQELRIPAEIWRRNCDQVSKLLITEAEIRSLTLDPYLETADADVRNNYYPQRIDPQRFRLIKPSESKNEMQKAKSP